MWLILIKVVLVMLLQTQRLVIVKKIERHKCLVDDE